MNCLFLYLNDLYLGKKVNFKVFLFLYNNLIYIKLNCIKIVVYLVLYFKKLWYIMGNGC